MSTGNPTFGAPKNLAQELLKASGNITNIKRYEEPSSTAPNDVDSELSVVEAEMGGHRVKIRTHPPEDYNKDPITWSGEIDGTIIGEEDAVELLGAIEKGENTN